MSGIRNIRRDVQVIATQTRLSLCNGWFWPTRYFRSDSSSRRKPARHTPGRISGATVEVQIVAGTRIAESRSVEARCVVLGCLPDRAEERPLPAFFLGGDNRARHNGFLQKLATHEREIVEFTLKASSQHPIWAQPRGRISCWGWGGGVDMLSLLRHALYPAPRGWGRSATRRSHSSCPERPRNIGRWWGRFGVESLSSLRFLEISRDHRVQLLHLGHEEMFTFHCAIMTWSKLAAAVAACCVAESRLESCGSAAGGVGATRGGEQTRRQIAAKGWGDGTYGLFSFI